MVCVSQKVTSDHDPVFHYILQRALSMSVFYLLFSPNMPYMTSYH